MNCRFSTIIAGIEALDNERDKEQTQFAHCGQRETSSKPNAVSQLRTADIHATADQPEQ